MKKACVACGKQIPRVALDCVFCGGKQPADESAEIVSAHATDPTMVGIKLSDVEAAHKAAMAARQAAPVEPAAAPVEPAAPVTPSPEPAAEPGHADAKESAGEVAKESGSNGAVVPPQARLTAAVPVVVPPAAPAEAPKPERPAAPPRERPHPSPVADEAQPFSSLSRTVMGVGGAVLVALFFLPWHGVTSWQLLRTLAGADFMRQLFYLTGGVVLLATAVLPLPFAFRALVGTVIATLPVVLGAGGLLDGWRGVVAALAILGLPATHLLRSHAKSSTAARALVALAVAAVVLLYLVPMAEVVPIVGVVKLIFSGEIGPAVLGVFVLIPLVFAALSLLGLLGRDLTDVGVLLSVLILLWAPVVVALRGLLLEDGTQLYVALALLWASAIAALSLAQLLSLAARPRAA